MESFLNRYRSITVLLLVIFGQLVLLAVTEKNEQNASGLRALTVNAVSPVARILEWGRNSSVGFIRNYVLLRDANEENRKLRTELNDLKVKNVFLQDQLNMADRARALQLFAAQTPSKTLAATVYMSAAGSDSNAVYVDRGTLSGVERGMGVVTPDGIVGKVIQVYASSALVRLVSDQDFAAGVVTASGVRGVLKGQAKPLCKVDYVPFNEKISAGDLLYTSGEDHIYPRGFPVGVVKAVANGQPFKDIMAEPAGLRRGVPEDVLIILEGVHQDIPEPTQNNQPVYINPAPSAEQQAGDAIPVPQVGTDADKMRNQTRSLGEAQGHTFGGNDGKLPDFNANAKPPVGQSPPAGANGPTSPPPAGAPKTGDTSRPDTGRNENARHANQAAGVPPAGGRQN